MISYDERSWNLRQALKQALADKDAARLAALLADPTCRAATGNDDASLVYWVDKAVSFIRRAS